MAGFPPISVRQPRAHDIVDDPVEACGVGTGFEATFAARVRDGNGVELAQATITAGGTGIWGNFHVELPLGGPPPSTPRGTLEVFEFSASDGSSSTRSSCRSSSVARSSIPITASRSTPSVPGDTLSTIAEQWYGAEVDGRASSRPTATRSPTPT